MGLRKSNQKVEASTPLASFRSMRGISLGALAQAVQYDKGNLSRIERAKIRPGAGITIRISEYFEGELTRDEIMFPEFHTGKKKPVRSATPAEAR